MSMKYKLESLDGIDDAVKPLYVSRDGAYYLDVDGVQSEDETHGLKSALDKERDAAKTASKQAKELQRQLDEVQHKIAQDSGSIDTLEKSWQDKLAKRETELQAEIDQLRTGVQKLTAGQKSMELASKIAVKGSESALCRFVSDRLMTEYRDGEPHVVVLDRNGKRCAMSMDELEADLRSDPSIAPLIARSQATGTGAARSEGGNTAGATMQRKTFDALQPTEKSKFLSEGGKVI